MIERAHGTTQEAALEKLRSLCTELEGRFGMKIVHGEASSSVKGKGVTGTARIDETHIHLNLKLGIPASLIAGKVEAGINTAIDTHFC